jgi:hypothetical protein
VFPDALPPAGEINCEATKERGGNYWVSGQLLDYIWWQLREPY